jgi:hypothetical protein
MDTWQHQMQQLNMLSPCSRMHTSKHFQRCLAVKERITDVGDSCGAGAAGDGEGEATWLPEMLLPSSKLPPAEPGLVIPPDSEAIVWLGMAGCVATSNLE